MTVRVRLAREDETVAVGDLTVAVYVDGGFIPAGDDYTDVLADARRRREQAELWVAVEDDDLLGSTTFCPAGSPYAEIAGPDEGEFRMLAVDPRARGRGIGELLVRRCLERCVELGYAALVMSSMREMGDAHRLYERLGFVRIPDQDWSPVNDVCLLAFRRALGRDGPGSPSPAPPPE